MGISNVSLALVNLLQNALDVRHPCRYLTAILQVFSAHSRSFDSLYSMDTNAKRLQTPSNASTNQTTRDQRLQVQILRAAGLSYSQVHEQLGLTLRQISYAVNHRVTPQKRKGRPSTLAQEEVNDIITWTCASKANRRTSWMTISI